jgi:predicted DNA-binding protein with PD1-like motif
MGMRDAGLKCGTVRLADFDARPLQYVRPMESASDEHVAFYSDTYRFESQVHVLLAVATFGEKDGVPFAHCHAIWVTPEGQVKGGHLHNDVVCVVNDSEVRAWGLADATMRVEYDPETNFSLFCPRPMRTASTSRSRAGRCVVAKIRPNEDLVTSVESICQKNGIGRARIAGSVGSIVGARFTDGRTIRDTATEILVITGSMDPGDGSPRARLQIALIDPEGDVHIGELAKGENAVLICFELVLVEEST